MPAPNPHDAPFAHSSEMEGEPWEPLFTEDCETITGGSQCNHCERLIQSHGHLNKVAHLTAKFAREMFPPDSQEADPAAEWGKIAGLWHDLGKFEPAFQARLQGASETVDHSGAGALAANKIKVTNGKSTIAAIIAGHHCGLANFKEARLEEGRKITPLKRRLAKATVPESELPASLQAILNSAPSSLTEIYTGSRFSTSTLTRMLYSCLTDADSVATEAYCDPGSQRSERSYHSIAELRRLQDTNMADLAHGSTKSDINQVREEILASAIARATATPGWFTLNVPTGGGKTLTSLSFALHHAEQHQLRRVIFGIPFTSIIDQTAQIYRHILGDASVLEHHSAVTDFEDIEEDSNAALRARMTAEDWNAPVIVTTNVQLLESLFAHKRSRTRKIHRIARSVIVLDEMQSVPIQLLTPIIALLDNLVKSYGCSVVVCTATQPAIQKSVSFPKGIDLPEDRAIAPKDLHSRPIFQRVDVTWPDQTSSPWSPEILAEQMAMHSSSLAISHKKADATLTYKALTERLGHDHIYHLSTFMVPAHRKQVFRAIRNDLKLKISCHIVSTQLIEAGVDIDLPVVFRALAGVDSLVQAAGRCNREGGLPDGKKGSLIIYEADSQPPPGVLRTGLATTKALLAADQQLDIFDANTIQTYFENLYSLKNLDAADIYAQSTRFNFESVGQDMRLIEELPTTTVVVTFDKIADERIAEARLRPTKANYRLLQPYTLTIFDWVADSLRPHLEPLSEGSETFVLDTKLYSKLYSGKYGLDLENADNALEPETLIL